MGPGLLLLFVVGDILGTGVYALTGDVAAEVGGAAWVPFLVAFLIATITAFSYLELVTKYPQAAGAALYAHKAFGIQFVTFLIAFVVMCSGITSASTAARTFASNFFKGFDFSLGTAGIVALALFFMIALALINLRGVGESVKLNVFLTIIEISGLLMVILVGLWAFTGGARRRLLARGGVRHRRGQERLHGRDRGDLAGLLRDGGLRGLGEHGRGDQGPGKDLPEDAADGPRHRRHRLHPGVDRGGGAGADR